MTSTEIPDDILRRHMKHEHAFFENLINKRSQAVVRLNTIFKMRDAVEDTPPWDLSNPQEYAALVDLLRNTQPIVYNTRGELRENFLEEVEERRAIRELQAAQAEVQAQLARRRLDEMIRRQREAFIEAERIRAEQRALEEEIERERLERERERQRLLEEDKRIEAAAFAEMKRRADLERKAEEERKKEQQRRREALIKFNHEKARRLERFNEEIELRRRTEQARKDNVNLLVKEQLKSLEEEKNRLEKDKNIDFSDAARLEAVVSNIEARLKSLEQTIASKQASFEQFKRQSENDLEEKLKILAIESTKITEEEIRDRENTRRRLNESIQQDELLRNQTLESLDNTISTKLKEFNAEKEALLKTWRERIEEEELKEKERLKKVEDGKKRVLEDQRVLKDQVDFETYISNEDIELKFINKKLDVLTDSIDKINPNDPGVLDFVENSKKRFNDLIEKMVGKTNSVLEKIKQEKAKYSGARALEYKTYIKYLIAQEKVWGDSLNSVKIFKEMFERALEILISIVDEIKQENEKKKKLKADGSIISESVKEQSKNIDSQHEEEEKMLKEIEQRKKEDEIQKINDLLKIKEAEVAKSIADDQQKLDLIKKDLVVIEKKLKTEKEAINRNEKAIAELETTTRVLMERKQASNLKFKKTMVKIDSDEKVGTKAQEQLNESLIERIKRETEERVKEAERRLQEEKRQSNLAIQANLELEAKLKKEKEEMEKKKLKEEEAALKRRAILAQQMMEEKMEMETDAYKELLLESAYEFGRGDVYNDVDAGIHEWLEKLKSAKQQSNILNQGEISESASESAFGDDFLGKESNYVMMTIKYVNEISHVILNDDLSAPNKGLETIMKHLNKKLEGGELKSWRLDVRDEISKDFENSELSYPDEYLNPPSYYVYRIIIGVELFILMRDNLNNVLVGLLEDIDQLKENHGYDVTAIHSGSLFNDKVENAIKYHQRVAILINLATKYMLYALELQKHCTLRIRHLLIRFYHCGDFFKTRHIYSKDLFKFISLRYPNFNRVGVNTGDDRFLFNKKILTMTNEIKESKKNPPLYLRGQINHDKLKQMLLEHRQRGAGISNDLFQWMYNHEKARKEYHPSESVFRRILSYLNEVLFLDSGVSGKQNLTNWSQEIEITSFVKNNTHFNVDLISDAILKYVYGKDTRYSFVDSIRDLTVGDILKESQSEALNKLIRGDLNNYLLLHTQRAVLNWDAFAIASLDASYNIHLSIQTDKDLYPIMYRELKMNLLNVTLNGKVRSEYDGLFIINLINSLLSIHTKLTQDLEENREAFNIFSIYSQNPYSDEISKEKNMLLQISKSQKIEKNGTKPTTIAKVPERPGFTMYINEDYYITFNYVSSLVKILIEEPEFIKKSKYVSKLNELNNILNKT